MKTLLGLLSLTAAANALVLGGGPLIAARAPAIAMFAENGDDVQTYDTAPATIQSKALEVKKAELKVVAEEVVAAAAKFSPETAGFAQKYCDTLIETGSAAAAGDFVLIEGCLLDSPDCENLEAAIKKLQTLAGSDWSGTAC